MAGSDLIQGSFYGYNGESYDPITKLQFLRARYYDPDQGRFTAKDTWAGILTSPITQNAYIYANSDPVNYSDPSGHASFLNNIANGLKAVGNAIVTGAKAVVNTAKAVANTVTNFFSPPKPAPTANWLQSASRVPTPTANWVTGAGAKAVASALKPKGTASFSNARYYSDSAVRQYLEYKAEAQAYTQALVSKANQFVCTTAERIGSGGGNTNSGGINLISLIKNYKGEYVWPPNLIHNAVQDHIVYGDQYARSHLIDYLSLPGVEKPPSPSGRVLETEIKIAYGKDAKDYMGRNSGRADIVDIDTGELWEIKSNYRSEGLGAASHDVEGYTMKGNVYATWKTTKLDGKVPISGGEDIFDGTFLYESSVPFASDYYVTYTNPSEGVILYDYSKVDRKLEDILFDALDLASSLFGRGYGLGSAPSMPVDGSLPLAQ